MRTRCHAVPFTVLGLAAVLVAVPACGTATDTSGDTEEATVWIVGGATQAAFQSSFDEWNQAHPGEKIAVQVVADGLYREKIRTATRAGQAPTLIYGWAGGVLKSYVDAGAVADLTPDIDDTVRNRFLASAYGGGQIDGKTYALPNNDVKPALIYYNRDLFAQIGAQPPKTWDDLMALVPRFKARGIAPFTVSGQAKWQLLMWMEYLVDRVGGPGVMRNVLAGNANAWSDPAFGRAVTMIQDLVRAGGFVDGFNSVSTDSGADVALLYTGKAAMSLNRPDAYRAVQKAQPAFITGGKLGYAPFPTVAAGTGDPADVVGDPGTYWSISAKATAKQKKIALDYLRTALLNDSGTDALIKAGSVPPASGIRGRLAASADGPYLQALYDAGQKAPNLQLPWDQALSPAPGDALLTVLPQVFALQMTPDQFSDNMNRTPV